MAEYQLTEDSSSDELFYDCLSQIQEDGENIQRKVIDVDADLKELLDGAYFLDFNSLMSEHYCGGEDVTGWSINPCKKPTEADEPKYKEYSTVESRIKSFKGVKAKFPQPRKVFAEAGLFYMGAKDHVQCFYCGGTLRDWKKGLDPFYEHAGWYENCLFIKAIKGDEFVKSCSKSTESFAPYMQQSYPV